MHDLQFSTLPREYGLEDLGFKIKITVLISELHLWNKPQRWASVFAIEDWTCSWFWEITSFQHQCIITAHKRTLRQGNIFRSVCQEFCPRGGLPQCMLGYHPPPRPDPPGTRHPPPGPGTPLDQTPPTRHPPRTRHPPLGTRPPQTRHPPMQCMLGDTVNERVVCILLECNLVTF